jgi:hypothetical protein
MGWTSTTGVIAVSVLALGAVGSTPASAECGRVREPETPSWDNRPNGFQGACTDRLTDSRGSFVRVSVQITDIDSTEACAEVEEAKTGDYKNSTCTEKVGEDEGEYVLIVPPKCDEKEEEEDAGPFMPRVTTRSKPAVSAGTSNPLLVSLVGGESTPFSIFATRYNL